MRRPHSMAASERVESCKGFEITRRIFDILLLAYIAKLPSQFFQRKNELSGLDNYAILRKVFYHETIKRR